MATISQITPLSGSIYTVTLGGITGSGTMGLNLVDNGKIRDLSGDGLTQSSFAFSFQDETLLDAGPRPAAVTVADVNGDGIPDLVVMNTVTGNGYSTATPFSILLGNGNGTFQNQATFSAGNYTHALAVADVNGDGKPDIVVVNEPNGTTLGTVSVILGNGNGTFQNCTTFNAGYRPYAVAIADFNGDGKPDLAVTNGTTPATVSVLLGDGDGTFMNPATFATGAGSRGVVAADFNGDGKPDLVVANFSSSDVSVLLGNGNGTFQNQVTLATSTTIYFAIADVNGDGKLDLICPNETAGTVSILLGNGDGSFQHQATFATGLSPTSVAVGDINGDGKPDLVVGNFTGSSVSLLLGNGNGDGTFGPQTQLGTGSYPTTVALSDLSGDGRQDIVLVNRRPGGAAVILPGNGDGTFASVGTGKNPVSLTIADLNGDGNSDVVVTNTLGTTWSVLLGSGNGRFENQIVIGPGPALVTAADVTFKRPSNSPRFSPNWPGPSQNTSPVWSITSQAMA